jgi:MoxR-like ATPase
MTIATFADLAKLSTDEIALLHRNNLPGKPVPTKKSVACQDLAVYALDYGMGLSDLRRAVAPAAPAAPQAVDAVMLNTVDAALRQHIEDQANALGARLSVLSSRVTDGVSDLGHQMNKLRDSQHKVNTAFNDSLATLTDEIYTLAAQPKVAIDQAAIDAAVAAQVDAAFGAFKSTVVAAGVEAQVADTASILSACQIIDAEIAFGVRVTDAKAQVMNLTHWHRADAPAIDPCFVWTEEILRHLLLASSASSTLANIWLGGEKGAGKSETARQFAARTGRAFTRINFQRFSTVEDFLGATGLDNGSTAFEPGPFLKAYSTPGSVILLDEITNADPGVLNALNGFLEPGAAVTFGGKVWSKAAGVLILAADNTLGNGDQTGRYAGTRAQGAPLLNRFGQVVHMTFLPRAVEIEAVVKRTGCTEKLAAYVLDAISVARAKVQSGEIIDAPSIRNVMAFIEALAVLPVRAAWDATIAAAQPAESAVALQSVFESCISDSVINKLI